MFLTFVKVEQSFDRSQKEHAHHHDGKYRDRVTGHVHDEEIHRNLFQWSQCNVPRLLHNQIAIYFPTTFVVNISKIGIETWWTGHFITVIAIGPGYSEYTRYYDVL